MSDLEICYDSSETPLPDRTKEIGLDQWGVGTDDYFFTVGGYTCLCAIVHNRKANKGGLAHINTTTLDMKELWSKAARTIALMINEASIADEFDLWLGAGRMFTMLPASGTKNTPSTDFPTFLNILLTTQFFPRHKLTYKIHDHRIPPTITRTDINPGDVAYCPAKAGMWFLNDTKIPSNDRGTLGYYQKKRILKWDVNVVK
jgi:hypothetical protein